MLSLLQRHFLGSWVAYLVLALSLVPTAVVYYRVRINVEARDRTRFDRIVGEQYAAIEQRIPRYVEEMMGVRGLFAANPSVNADQWRQYLASVQIQSLYPGIGTLGYLERVDAADKQAFLRAFPGFRANRRFTLSLKASGPSIFQRFT